MTPRFLAWRWYTAYNISQTYKPYMFGCIFHSLRETVYANIRDYTRDTNNTETHKTENYNIFNTVGATAIN